MKSILKDVFECVSLGLALIMAVEVIVIIAAALIFTNAYILSRFFQSFGPC